nr:hypothetical protein [Sodalis glossinidius]
MREGIPAVAQVSGPADQRQLTSVVRAALKDAGLLGAKSRRWWY